MTELTESQWRARVLVLLTEIRNAVATPEPAMMHDPELFQDGKVPAPGSMTFVEGTFFRRVGDPKPDAAPEAPRPVPETTQTFVPRRVAFTDDTQDVVGIGSEMILSGRGGFNSPGPQDGQ